MILPIKHKVDWELITQNIQTQINKDNIRENNKTVDHDYKVGYKVVLDNQSTQKYETTYKGPFVITQFCTNGMVALQCGEKKIRYNIFRINPHRSDTNVEDNNY